MSILVTGGAGYVGSHIVVDLLEKGYEIVIIDNFDNSSRSVIANIKTITDKNVKVYPINLLDKEALHTVFEENVIESVIHCAGYKSVEASVASPLQYYENNIVGTLNLCMVMSEHQVYKLIFSSTAAVYGNPDVLPVTEKSPVHPLNPYGRSKYMLEEILTDLAIADPTWKIIVLRYFNPVGAHPSGLIGENPNGIPTNLLPLIAKVADEEMDRLMIFGGDYHTPDGTGIRDYIHVTDLARGHVHALRNSDQFEKTQIINLGTGTGYSVLEMVESFAEVSGKSIPYQIVSRRKGDMAANYADTRLAAEKLNWQATKDLRDMCRDAWNWKQHMKGTAKIM